MAKPKTVDINQFVPREGEERRDTPRGLRRRRGPAPDDFHDGTDTSPTSTPSRCSSISGRRTRPPTARFASTARLDGETVEKAGVDIGYLHRGFEKMVETKQYNQVIPYTDRLNYCSGADQQRRLLQGGRADDGHRGTARARSHHPRHHHGDPADHGPHDLLWRQPRRHRGAHQLLVLLQRARKTERRARGADRRAADVQLHARRRSGLGPARRVARRRQGGPERSPEGHRGRDAAWSGRTGSSRTARAASA